MDDLESVRRVSQYITDIREDVFSVMDVRMFTVILPDERCVRFDSWDKEPQYTVVSTDHFDDLDWRRV